MGEPPYGKYSWAGKRAAGIGATTASRTAVAQSQSRATLLVLDLAVMGQPEAYIQLPADSIHAHHTVTDEATRAFWRNGSPPSPTGSEVAGIVPEAGQPDSDAMAAAE